MRLTLPVALYRLTDPSDPTPTTTRFVAATLMPGLRSETPGWVGESGPGYTVTKVGDVPLNAVTLATIATSEPGPPVSSGIPSTPAASTLRTSLLPNFAFAQLGVPVCVSQIRAGVASGVNCVPVVVVNQPSRSTAILTEPAPFQIDTEQAPAVQVTGTITRFGSALCATRLRFEAFGLPVPAANAVSTVDTVGLIAVRLKTTALTPLVGTGLPMPLTAKVRTLSCPIGEGTPLSQRLAMIPSPGGRVSQMRIGVVDVYRPDDVADT